MTDQDFCAQMRIGIPHIPSPAGLASVAATGVIKGNADIAINHPDAVGATQEQEQNHG